MKRERSRLVKMGNQLLGFIVNPISGGGQGLAYWKEVEQACKEKRIPYKVLFTNYEGHGIVLAKQAAQDPDLDMVIAVGGDGTVNEVANGLFPSNVPMGYIPAGTGNDFARVMNIPSNPVKALEKILNGKQEKMDIVAMRGRKYLNVAGIGFDGQVTLTANRSSYKRWFGKLSYIISVFQVLFSYRPTEATITIDRKQYQYKKVWLVAVANIPYYGGGMKICPTAVWNDGYLDICIVSGMSRLKLLFMFPLVFIGKHIKLKQVTTMRGKSIHIESSAPMQIHADGELLGQTPIDIQLESHPFTIII